MVWLDVFLPRYVQRQTLKNINDILDVKNENDMEDQHSVTQRQLLFRDRTAIALLVVIMFIVFTMWLVLRRNADPVLQHFATGLLASFFVCVSGLSVPRLIENRSVFGWSVTCVMLLLVWYTPGETVGLELSSGPHRIAPAIVGIATTKRHALFTAAAMFLLVVYKLMTSPVALESSTLLVANAYLGDLVVNFWASCIIVPQLQQVALKDMERASDAVRESWKRHNETEKRKTRFLSQVSHEIRTPLVCVTGVVDSMCRQLSNGDAMPPMRVWRHQMRLVSENCKFLTDMVNDLVAYFKETQDEKEQVITYEEMDVRRVVSSAFEMQRAVAEQSGTFYGVHVSPNVPKLVLGDGMRIKEIILKLVSNSLKFISPPNGVVLLNVATTSNPTPRRLSALPMANVCSVGGDRCAKCSVLRLSVTDNGCGIPEHVQDKIFQPFYQVHHDDGDGQHVGSGLGLTLVQRLCERLGGGCWVESSELGPTTFNCEFVVHPTQMADIVGWSLVDMYSPSIKRTFRVPTVAHLHYSMWKSGQVDGKPPWLRGVRVERDDTDRDDPWICATGGQKCTVVVNERIVCPCTSESTTDCELFALRKSSESRGNVFWQVSKQPTNALCCQHLPASPLNDEITSPALLQVSNTPFDARTHVLVVDDVRVSRMTLRIMLRRANVPFEQIHMKNDGQQACDWVYSWVPQQLEASSSPPPLVVLMDLNMPILNGADACEQLREWLVEEYPIFEAKVTLILLTADSQASERMGAWDDVVLKPVIVERLCAILRAHAPNPFL